MKQWHEWHEVPGAEWIKPDGSGTLNPVVRAEVIGKVPSPHWWARVVLKKARIDRRPLEAEHEMQAEFGIWVSFGGVP